MHKSVNKLPDEVSAKYNVLKGHPLRFVHPNVGPVDLTNISLATADRLVAKGVKCLMPVKKNEK